MSVYVCSRNLEVVLPASCVPLTRILRTMRLKTSRDEKTLAPSMRRPRNYISQEQRFCGPKELQVCERAFSFAEGLSLV